MKAGDVGGVALQDAWSIRAPNRAGTPFMPLVDAVRQRGSSAIVHAIILGKCTPAVWLDKTPCRLRPMPGEDDALGAGEVFPLTGYVYLHDFTRTGEQEGQFRCVTHEDKPDGSSLWYELPEPLALSTALESGYLHENQWRAAKVRKGRDTVDPRKHRTLQLLVAAMAQRAYGHDVASLRSDAAARIVKDAECLGLTIHKDTARDAISEAIEAVRPWRNSSTSGVVEECTGRLAAA